jgi:hypothetical protein
MLSKQAENKCPKNGDQHPCTLERARSSSFFRLSSSSFCHRWRRETDPNLCNPRLIEINSGGGEANLFSQVFQHVVGSNRDKTEKWPAKFIPWRRHHLHLNVVIRKPKSPCHRFKKVNDTMSPLPSSKPPWRDTIHPISSLLPERRSRKQISHTTKHSMINLISI